MAYWDEEMAGLLPGASRIDPYQGLLGGLLPQDRAMAIMAMGAGLMGGTGRTKGEAFGKGMQQGMQGFLDVSGMAGRQRALAEETQGRMQDRKIREQQFEMAKRAEALRAQQAAEEQAAAAQRRAGTEDLIRQFPQYDALVRAGVSPDKLLPQMFPKAPEQSPLAKLIQERDALPPGSPARVTYDAAIQKATMHPPPASMNVSYGAPVPIQGPGGEINLAQPSNRAGQPPQLLIDPRTNKPAVRPPESSQTKDPTEFQAKAGLYFKSMEQASKVINDLETKGSDAIKPGVQEFAVPAKGLGAVVSGERLQYLQGARQWIDSINRVRSGAQLPEYEYERALLTFFPAFGDDAQTIKNKSSARKQEETAMRDAAGRALPQQQPQSPVGWDADKEARYQQWLKSQGK